jgi:hypothetical protein
MEALNLWAGDDRLIVADFYFWKSGAEIQRSQEGLFRSLLWQVLNQNMSLASTLFAELYLPHAEWDEFPTFHQLRRAFGRLTSDSLTSTRIAIVIDGLDEFDAQRFTMTELGEMFITATKVGNIKALLSSRPLTAFTDCFASQPQLELQQLTHDDITTYVFDSLSVHPQMVYLTATYEDQTKALVEEIVSSASGVFLWVKLVVKSLLDGLQNGDQIEDLQIRLRSLPRDLEALFTHMLVTCLPRTRRKQHAYFRSSDVTTKASWACVCRLVTYKVRCLPSDCLMQKPRSRRSWMQTFSPCRMKNSNEEKVPQNVDFEAVAQVSWSFECEASPTKRKQIKLDKRV